MAHEGCLKCRRFYAGHQAKACPNGFPTQGAYRRLTKEMAAKAQEDHERKSKRTAEATNSDSAKIEEVSDQEPPLSDSSESGYVPTLDKPHLYPQLLASDSKLEGPFLPCEPLLTLTATQ